MTTEEHEIKRSHHWVLKERIALGFIYTCSICRVEKVRFYDQEEFLLESLNVDSLRARMPCMTDEEWNVWDILE